MAGAVGGLDWTCWRGSLGAGGGRSRPCRSACRLPFEQFLPWPSVAEGWVIRFWLSFTALESKRGGWKGIFAKQSHLAAVDDQTRPPTEMGAWPRP